VKAASKFVGIPPPPCRRRRRASSRGCGVRRGSPHQPPGGVQRRVPARFDCVQVVHDDEHGLGFLDGDQVVHDEVHPALNVPTPFVFSPAVLQIQNRIARLAGVIARWRVNEAGPPLAGDLGEVPPRAHLPVGDVFRTVVVHARLGDLDSAVLPAGSEECLARRISHLDAVHDQGVVVEAHHLRREGGDPHAVRAPRHVVTLSQVHLHLLGIGRRYADRHPVIGINAGVLRPPGR
jgi:hypothetical protein